MNHPPVCCPCLSQGHQQYMLVAIFNFSQKDCLPASYVCCAVLCGGVKVGQKRSLLGAAVKGPQIKPT